MRIHTTVCATLATMNADRLTVSMDAELGTAVREAAERAGLSVSAWLADAAADRLRNELLGLALEAWEAEQGPLTEEELGEAAASMGIPWPSVRNAV